MKKITALLTLLLAFNSMAMYADDVKSLQSLLQPMHSLQGHFVQKQFDADGELLQQSDGKFSLQRPGKFSWHTVAPFEQELISNGQTLWLYDPDLEQVSIKKVDASMQQTPAVILSGNAEQLSESFTVVELASADADIRQFTLQSRQAEPVFEQLILTFKDNLLSDLNVHDSLGQLTQFSLQQVSANNTLSAQVFEFVIPAGTEVISDE